jgi:hypothetical protein
MWAGVLLILVGSAFMEFLLGGFLIYFPIPFIEMLTFPPLIIGTVMFAAAMMRWARSGAE